MASRLLVATVDGVAELTRDGTGWRRSLLGLRGHHVSSLAIEPSSGWAFAGTHDDGVFRARAPWNVWEPAASGIAYDDVYSVATASSDGHVMLLAGTQPAHLFRSFDFGESWHEIGDLEHMPRRETWTFPAPPFIAHTKHIDVDPENPRRIFLAVEQGGLLCSEDAGEHFREIIYEDETFVYNRDAHRIVFNKHMPGEMILTGGDGVVRSLDSGVTWHRISTPAMRAGYPDAAFFDPHDGRDLFVFGAIGTPFTWMATKRADAALMKTSDRGATWEQVTAGLPEAMLGNYEAATLVSSPAGFRLYAGTTHGEIFESTDRGTQWRSIAADLPAMSKGDHYRLVT